MIGEPPLPDRVEWIALQTRELWKVVERCRRIDPGTAQTAVFLLPDECNYVAASEIDGLEHLVVVAQVAKITHSVEKAFQATASLGITDIDERICKAYDLVIDSNLSIAKAYQACERSSDVWRLFGNPRFFSFPLETAILAMVYPGEDDNGELGLPKQFGNCYLQDYVQPLRSRIAELDVEHGEEDLRKGCELIDYYIDAQLFLAARGLFDATFKFVDNCGWYPYESIYKTDFERFRILDIGELTEELDEVLAIIESKKWHYISDPNKPDFTPLPPLLQEYMNAACEARLTPEAIKAIWPKNIFDFDLVNNAEFPSAMERPNVSRRLPGMLWSSITRG